MGLKWRKTCTLHCTAVAAVNDALYSSICILSLMALLHALSSVEKSSCYHCCHQDRQRDRCWRGWKGLIASIGVDGSLLVLWKRITLYVIVTNNVFFLHSTFGRLISGGSWLLLFYSHFYWRKAYIMQGFGLNESLLFPFYLRCYVEVGLYFQVAWAAKLFPLSSSPSTSSS